MPRSLMDEMRQEACFRFQWRCESHEPGSEVADWVTAEKAVIARHTHAATTPQARSPR